ncbi:hypothetical protein LCGC14_2512090, partial [marine sediment metagenome]
GYYALNPDLAVWVNDEWKNVYEMMKSVEVKVPTQEEKEQWLEEYNRKLREQGHWDNDEFDNDPWYEDSDEYFDEATDPKGIHAMIDEYHKEKADGSELKDKEFNKSGMEYVKSLHKEAEETEKKDPPKKQDPPGTQIKLPF